MANEIQAAFNAVYADGPSSDPSEPSKPAIRQQVGGTIQGKWDELAALIANLTSLIGVSVQIKAPVRAASTANVTLSSIINGASFGGVTVATGDRIACVGQTDAATNGIYVVQASSAPVRATDADAATEVLGMAFFVNEGSEAGKVYACTTPNPIVLGTTALTFVVQLNMSILNGNISALTARLDQKLLPTRPLLVRGGSLRIPSMWYWSKGTGLLAQPASPGAGYNPAPVYWETQIQTAASDVRWVYFDKAKAAAGINPITVVEKNNSPLVDADGLLLIAYSINGVVTTDLPIVGGVAGGTVPNQWPAGKWTKACQRFNGQTVAYDADPYLVALGFTQAFVNFNSTGIYAGGDLEEQTQADEFVVAELYLYQPVAEDVNPPPALNLFRADNFLQSFPLEKELQVNSQVSKWRLATKIPAGMIADNFLIGVDQKTRLDWQVAGVDLYIGPEYGAAIAENDYPPLDPVSYAPQYGPDMWLLAGQEMPLYLQNLVGERQEGDPPIIGGFYSTKNGVAQVKEGSGQVTINADKCGSIGAIELRVKGTRGSRNDRFFAPFNVHVAQPSATNKSPRVLMISDSLNNRGLTRCVNDLLLPYNITPIWMGTINGADNEGDYTTDTSGLPGEAREGYEFADFIGMRLRGEPVTDWAAYMAGSKAYKAARMPFLRPATSGDPADQVYNGHRYDMRNYLTMTGQDDPNIVVIGLMTNDFYQRDAATARPQIAAGARVMFAQNRAALPNAKISWWGPTEAFTSNFFQFGNHYLARQQAIEAIRFRNDPNSHIIPVWAHQSSEFGYKVDTSGGAGINYAYKGSIQDSVHFNRSFGASPLRDQAALAIAAYIANNA